MDVPDQDDIDMDVPDQDDIDMDVPDQDDIDTDAPEDTSDQQPENNDIESTILEAAPHGYMHSMNYATFGQRFGAIWLDIFVLLPLAFARVWLGSLSKIAAILLVVPMTAAYCAYTIYCHGRFGQTLGKYAMGIRVVRATGERIGWREAWFRSSVDVAFAALSAIASLAALAAISDADYLGVGWLQRAQKLAALKPAWYDWTQTAGNIWTWSEIIVMLFNKRRRALHDFIAGTVVIAD